MDDWVGFGKREKDFVAVGAFGDDARHEERAAHFFPVGHIEFREERGERDSGVCFVDFTVRVEDGDRSVRESGEFRGAEGQRFSLISDGQAGGRDGWRVMVHLLRFKVGIRNAEQERQDGEREQAEIAILFHGIILVSFYALKSAILDDLQRSRRDYGRGRLAAVTF